MLIIPYQTRFSARSLPVVTLALIVVNLLVFLVFQGGDQKAYERAAAFYFNSQLPQIELPRYAAYLEREADPRAVQILRAIRSGADSPADLNRRAALMAMESDRRFMRELNGGDIVTPGEPEHAIWREQRERFNTLIGQVFTQRYALEPGSVTGWQLITYQFLHADIGHLLANLAVLLLAGPFAEAALGRTRFLLAYLGAGAFAGAVHILLSDQGIIGASGSISAAMAMVAVLYGRRKVPVFYWVFVYFNTARVPALALLPAWLLIEALQWALSPTSRVAYDAHIAGFLAGAVLAWLLKSRDVDKVDRILSEQFSEERAGEERSSLLRQAQQAASRLDTRRAARAYGELLQAEPSNTQYATAYFNMALLGRDKDTLADAALRVLWIRARGARTELRPLYQQMSQPHVLAVLPVDEQLRLARRLVATREDAGALRVLDRLLGDETLRHLYGRQLADCLLGLFTTYSRHGLRTQADQVRQRLSKHFPSPATLGGLAPNREPPLTIRGARTLGPSTRSTTAHGNPSTLPAGELELDLDTRIHTRWVE